MSSIDERFDSLTHFLGGAYNLLDGSMLSASLIKIRSDAIQMIEEIRRQKPYFPEVYIGYINNQDVNAIAFKDQDNYFIGINTGTFLMLSDYFKMILPRSKTLNSLDGNVNLKIEILLQHSFRFLINHEYGHISSGHIDYEIDKSKSQYMFEMAKLVDTNDGLDSQTLEMDADCFAATRALESAMKHSVDLKTELIYLSFSTYMLFRIFGTGGYDLKTLDGYTHPHPGIRQHIIGATITTALIKYSNDQVIDLYMRIHTEVFNDCEAVLNCIHDKSLIPILVTYTKEGWENTTNICNNWDKIRPLLEPFTKIALAPLEKMEFKLEKYVKLDKLCKK